MSRIENITEQFATYLSLKDRGKGKTAIPPCKV